MPNLTYLGGLEMLGYMVLIFHLPPLIKDDKKIKRDDNYHHKQLKIKYPSTRKSLTNYDYIIG